MNPAFESGAGEGILAAAEMLSRSRLTVVVTGAGMSRESGIRTFRGEDGFWREHRAEDLASLDGLKRDPVLVWQWYRERLMACSELEPHEGYHALVELQDHMGKLPVITQNVDGLHQKAGLHDVIELHGSLRTASCLDECGAPPVLLTGELLEDIPPRCSCGGILRPDVVLFGENLPREGLTRAFDLAERCDVMIVVGTSMVVYPAAAVPLAAIRNGAGIIEINIDATPLTEVAGTISLRGEAGRLLSEIAKVVSGQ